MSHYVTSLSLSSPPGPSSTPIQICVILNYDKKLEYLVIGKGGSRVRLLYPFPVSRKCLNLLESSEPWIVVEANRAAGTLFKLCKPIVKDGDFKKKVSRWASLT